MTKVRPLTVAVAAAGAVTLAAALGFIGGQVGHRPRTVPVSDDVSITTFGALAGPAAVAALAGSQRLGAGGLAGGAVISYLKFRVDLPDGVPPRQAEVWVARDSGKLPPMVELSTVPWSAWEQRGVTAVTAPRLGRVVDSVFPHGYETELHFDVSDVIRKAGEYAFALTAPTGDAIGLFVSQESRSGRVPTLMLQWEDAAASASAVWAPSPPPPPSPTAGPSDAAMPTDSPLPADSPAPSDPPAPSESPIASEPPPDEPSLSPSAAPSASDAPPPTEPDCEVGRLNVPDCGVLWGVAPGAHTTVDHSVALRRFEQLTQRPQAIYHAYHRGDELFPTAPEIALARDASSPRILFLNWKPVHASWRAIAHGDPWADRYLDRLAAHIRATYTEPFFFTMHHEPEDDVRTNAMFGMTAKDYAAAYRHVVERLRGNGVTNMVTAMVYMAYVPWNVKSWFADLYPGDDVVDWIGWDAYAYSEPGYGHGDFAEMMNRRSRLYPDWPGFYTWAARTFPDKPFMVAEWGVWYSDSNPGHQSDFFRSVGRQMELFPRVKALVYFETPRNQVGMDSRVHVTSGGLSAYRELGQLSVFQVRPPAG